MWCYSFDVSFKPATDDNASFASFASAPVGNLINCPRRLAISIATSLMHLPAELLILIGNLLSKGAWHPRPKTAGTRELAIEVAGGNSSVWAGTGQVENNEVQDSFGTKTISFKYLLLLKVFEWIRPVPKDPWASKLAILNHSAKWAAIFVLSTTLSTHQSLLEKLPFCTQPEYE